MENTKELFDMLISAIKDNWDGFLELIKNIDVPNSFESIKELILGTGLIAGGYGIFGIVVLLGVIISDIFPGLFS